MDKAKWPKENQQLAMNTSSTTLFLPAKATLQSNSNGGLLFPPSKGPMLISTTC